MTTTRSEITTCPLCDGPGRPDEECAACLTLCCVCYGRPWTDVVEAWEGDPEARRVCDQCEPNVRLTALERAADRRVRWWLGPRPRATRRGDNK